VIAGDAIIFVAIKGRSVNIAFSQLISN